MSLLSAVKKRSVSQSAKWGREIFLSLRTCRLHKLRLKSLQCLFPPWKTRRHVILAACPQRFFFDCWASHVFLETNLLVMSTTSLKSLISSGYCFSTDLTYSLQVFHKNDLSVVVCWGMCWNSSASTHLRECVDGYFFGLLFSSPRLFKSGKCELIHSVCEAKLEISYPFNMLCVRKIRSDPIRWERWEWDIRPSSPFQVFHLI